MHDKIAEQAPEQARAMLSMTGAPFTPRARTFAEQNRTRILEKPLDPSALLMRIRRIMAFRESA